ncbi:MAG: NUDIX hydrolase, partial [Candidatus Enterosoma sp.]|nr:NUDIX hydrolase [Candidatus Enterosoma sp.]
MAKGKRIREENVFHGIGFEIENTKTERDDGSVVPWQLIHYYGCSCVLAINEKEEVLIEANFRYPYCKEILEIPAGEKEEGETWLDAAKRELKEETGYVGEEWSDLGIIYPSVGSSDE